MRKLLLFFLIPFLGISQTQIGQNLNGVSSDKRFGNSVKLSSNGNVAIIGSNGTVKVYEDINGVWTQVGQDLFGENTTDFFGHDVSISDNGQIIAVSAIYFDNVNGSDVGEVKIFENINNVWTQIGNHLTGLNSTDWFGFSISLNSSGNKIAVGIRNYSDIYFTGGQVKVFENINNVWTQIGQNLNGTDSGYFGWSVSLSDDGNTLAASGTWLNGVFNHSGITKVYQNINNNWTQIGQNIEGESNNDFSGVSISLSSDGNKIAIGASSNDIEGIEFTNEGHVRVFENILGNWVQIGSDINGLNIDDHFGSKVSLSGDGNILAVGIRDSDSNGNNSGQIQIYKNLSGIWTQIGTSINGDSEENLHVVSISKNASRIIVGNPQNDFIGNNAGQVKVYELSSILNSITFVQDNFTIYPNPSYEILTVKLQNNLELLKVNFYNTLGQIVKTTNTTNINVSDLAKGNYYVEIITNQGKATKQLLVK